MKNFEYINAKTVDEAVSALREFEGEAQVIAGGTDLVGAIQDAILPTCPSAVVNIKNVNPSLSYIKEEGGFLKIGSLTTLSEIEENGSIKEKWPALAEATHKVGSRSLKDMGTIGGNICQFNRCWYFRAKDNYFNCIRKGGNICQALIGDNRYHSIFGATQGCVCVNPSDIAPALVALNASIVTSSGRTIEADGFWDFAIPGSTVLDDDEIVTEIQVPIPASTAKSVFMKFALRRAIDFPIVNCAVAINNGSARVCLNAVFTKPYRALESETIISGQSINEANANSAGEAAVQDATFLPMNKYKAQIAKTLVKRTVLACGASS
jgi:xanthine dehydrogenase YagS FAD-binding subunit